MKTFKNIEYIRSLGEYLDNNKIKWSNNGDNTINITVKNDSQLFRLAFTFRKFFDKLNKSC